MRDQNPCGVTEQSLWAEDLPEKVFSNVGVDMGLLHWEKPVFRLWLRLALDMASCGDTTCRQLCLLPRKPGHWPPKQAQSYRIVGIGVNRGPGGSPVIGLGPGDPAQPRAADRARLRAHSALLSRRPHQALLELADDSSEKATQIKLQALQSVNDYATAGSLSLALGNYDEANRFFWLADLPDEVDTVQGPRFGRTSQTTQNLSRQPSRVPGKPLADARTLLQDSADTRQQIAELLAAVVR